MNARWNRGAPRKEGGQCAKGSEGVFWKRKRVRPKNKGEDLPPGFLKAGTGEEGSPQRGSAERDCAMGGLMGNGDPSSRPHRGRIQGSLS